MYRYVICIAICTIIWIINGRWIAQGVKEDVASEAYIHTGLGIFFTLLTLELTLGTVGMWTQFNISQMRIIGLILYIPSAYLVAAAMHDLQHKGRPESGDPTATTIFIDAGIYGAVRQPLTLGVAIWSIALILVFQSILSVFLSILSVFCFWMSARKESEYNIKKFGDRYKEYMDEVPMWNVFRVLKKC
ncbi:MAG: NnrU family protein [Halobacteriota archaeon]|nr:NnrU family protein [Halobacteriota archaeon]